MSKDILIVTTTGCEVMVKKHSSLEYITLLKCNDKLDMTSIGLEKEEALKLIRNLMEVSGITQEYLGEPSFKYILPLKLKVFRDTSSRLVRNKFNGSTFMCDLEKVGEADSGFQTRFTEAEFNAIVKEFPEFSVLYKEVL